MLQERETTEKREVELPHHPFVRGAYLHAKESHNGQTRKDGGDYVDEHCRQVQLIISQEWGITEDLDPEMNAAALLHDEIEDTDVTYEQLVETFGMSVANMVEGVSKFKSDEVQKLKHTTFETRRKVLSTGYEDPRVLLIKLADRLHNFRTMEHMSQESQLRKAEETIEIYSKVARALGMWKVKTELEDWSFRYLDPKEFERFSAIIDADPRRSEDFIAYNKTHLESLLIQNGIVGRVEVRKNGYWALYKKAEKYARLAKGDLADINDVVSFRIRVSSVNDCYRTLGVVHQFGLPNCAVLVDRFDEFIASPRPNKYQAMQTTLEWHGGHWRHAVEVAIATEDMEEFNNNGIVAKIREGETNLDEYLMKSVFVQNSDPSKLKLKLLLKNATGVDLAYEVLGEFGGARADHLETPEGEVLPLTTIFQNASILKVVASETRTTPKQSWLPYVLPETELVIRNQLKVYDRTEAIAARQAELDQVLHKRGIIDLSDLGDLSQKLMYDYGCESVTELSFLVTRSQKTLNDFESALDGLHITKEELCWTSIYIAGRQDEPGILRDVVEWAQEMKKTIVKDESHVSPNGTFTISMIMKGLTDKEQLQIKDKLSSDSRFSRVIVV